MQFRLIIEIHCCQATHYFHSPGLVSVVCVAGVNNITDGLNDGSLNMHNAIVCPENICAVGCAEIHRSLHGL